MKIVETNTDGHRVFKVYPRNSARKPDEALSALVRALDAMQVPYVVGPKAGDELLLLSFGPVSDAQRDELCKEWGTCMKATSTQYELRHQHDKAVKVVPGGGG